MKQYKQSAALALTVAAAAAAAAAAARRKRMCEAEIKCFTFTNECLFCITSKIFFTYFELYNIIEFWVSLEK